MIFRFVGKVLLGLATVAVTTALSFGFATAAGANEYEVWSCLGPAGETLSADAWTVRTNDAATGDVSMTDDCATGGPIGLHVSDLGVTGARRARIDLSFDLPRGSAISGYELNRSIRVVGAVSGYSYAAAIRESVPGSDSDDGCASYLSLPSFNCSNAGSHTNPADPTNVVNRSGLNLSGLSAWAACLSNGCSPPFAPPSAELNLFQTVVSVVDNAAPTVTGLGGAITRAAPVSGVADLFVEAGDSNAGVKSFSLSIDGVPNQTIENDTSPTCVEPYDVPRPCPTRSGRVFSVDTSALAPGPHTIDGTVTDAAGNTAPFGPVSFKVADDAPDLDNGTPAAADALLTVDQEMIQRKAGKPVSITGKLATSGGIPISGARLEVRSAGMGRVSPIERPLDPVFTDAAGQFVIPTRARGANRIVVSYSPVVDGQVARSVSTIVRARISVRFKARPRKIKIGGKVRFQGRIVGGGPAVRGGNVEIQAIADGRWQTVANVRARSRGKFSWKYRFRHVERNALFSFRAVLRGTPGWPWPTVKSKKLKVRIRVPSK